MGDFALAGLLSCAKICLPSQDPYGTDTRATRDGVSSVFLVFLSTEKFIDARSSGIGMGRNMYP